MSKKQTKDELLNFEQACLKYELDAGLLRYAIRSGKIAYLKVKGKVYFKSDDLEIWLMARYRCFQDATALKQLRNEQKAIQRRIRAFNRDFKRGWVK